MTAKPFQREEVNTLRDRLSEKPRSLIFVAGPRQVGKTTLVRNALAQYEENRYSFIPVDQPDEAPDFTYAGNDTYEQITLPGDLLGDARPFLQDGMQVNLELWDEKPISVELPSQIEATIVEADAVVKGQTASSSYKPAILDNGVRIMVPPHIGSGTRIIVDVYEQAYVGKAS